MAIGATAQYTRRPRQRGLTLVETMATLAVAAILLTTAVPSLQDFLTRNRMSTEVNTFMASLYLARSEAVKRLQNVKVCPTTDYSTCSGTDWEPGWMVFLDINDDGVVNGSDAVLQQNPALPARFRIIGDIGRPYAEFQPTGQAGGFNNTFEFCDTGKVAKTRKVYLSDEGRIRVEKLTTTGCAVANNGDSGGRGRGGSGGHGGHGGDA